MRKILPIILVAAVVAGGYVGYRRGAAKSVPRGPVLVVSFLDADLGHAILVQTPEKSFAVVDPGPRDTAGNLVAYLTNAGVKSLDVILTNPSPEHAGALDTLARNFRVGRIIHGEQEFTETPKGSNDLILVQGDVIGLSRKVKIEALGPPKGLIERVAHRDDNNSLVTRIKFGRTTFLLTSDIRNEAEARLIGSGARLASTVLVVARHGRTGSTSLEMLSQVRPAYCVMLAGTRSNRPSRAVANRISTENTGAEVHRTDEEGRIDMISDGRSIVVETGDGRP